MTPTDIEAKAVLVEADALLLQAIGELGISEASLTDTQLRDLRSSVVAQVVEARHPGLACQIAGTAPAVAASRGPIGPDGRLRGRQRYPERARDDIARRRPSSDHRFETAALVEYGRQLRRRGAEQAIAHDMGATWLASKAFPLETLSASQRALADRRAAAKAAGWS